jgi:hypothetical protein
MAIGQLLDYRRFIDVQSVKCAVLLPEVPRPDLLELLAYAGAKAKRVRGRALTQ